MIPEAVPLAGVDLRLEPAPWAFAEAERRRIDRHWHGLVAERPWLWNGQVFVCTQADVQGGILKGRFARTDYAAFVAWRDWGWPDKAARNCFGVPAVVSSDGALVLGQMAQRTLNPGKIYPPSGSLEERDLQPDGNIDVEASMHLEWAEETGGSLSGARVGELFAIFDDHRLAVSRRFDLPIMFADVDAGFQAHRASEQDPELDCLVAVRAAAELASDAMGYVRAIARHVLPG